MVGWPAGAIWPCFPTAIFARFLAKVAPGAMSNPGRWRLVAVPAATHGTVRGLELPSDLGPPAAHGQAGAIDHRELHDGSIARRILVKWTGLVYRLFAGLGIGAR